MALMCHGRVDYAEFEKRHGKAFRELFADEIARLAPMREDGLVELEDGAIQVTATGWYVVRGVALVFDRYLKDSAPRERFSRIV